MGDQSIGFIPCQAPFNLRGSCRSALRRDIYAWHVKTPVVRQRYSRLGFQSESYPDSGSDSHCCRIRIRGRECSIREKRLNCRVRLGWFWRCAFGSGIDRFFGHGWQDHGERCGHTHLRRINNKYGDESGAFLYCWRARLCVPSRPWSDSNDSAIMGSCFCWQMMPGTVCATSRREASGERVAGEIPEAQQLAVEAESASRLSSTEVVETNKQPSAVIRNYVAPKIVPHVRFSCSRRRL